MKARILLALLLLASVQAKAFSLGGYYGQAQFSIGASNTAASSAAKAGQVLITSNVYVLRLGDESGSMLGALNTVAQNESHRLGAQQRLEERYKKTGMDPGTESYTVSNEAPEGTGKMQYIEFITNAGSPNLEVSGIPSVPTVSSNNNEAVFYALELHNDMAEWDGFLGLSSLAFNLAMDPQMAYLSLKAGNMAGGAVSNASLSYETLYWGLPLEGSLTYELPLGFKMRAAAGWDPIMGVWALIDKEKKMNFSYSGMVEWKPWDWFALEADYKGWKGAVTDNRDLTQAAYYGGVRFDFEELF